MCHDLFLNLNDMFNTVSSAPEVQLRLGELVHRLGAGQGGLRNKGAMLYVLSCLHNLGVDSPARPLSIVPQLKQSSLEAPARPAAGAGDEASRYIAPQPTQAARGVKPAPAGPLAGRALPDPTATGNVPEALLLRDMLLVLQAVDATHIALSARGDAYEVRPEFADRVPVSQRALIRKISEVGWVYRRICLDLQQLLHIERTEAIASSATTDLSLVLTTVADSTTGSEAGSSSTSLTSTTTTRKVIQEVTASSRPPGLVRQAFADAVRAELSVYFGLLSLLQQQLPPVPQSHSHHPHMQHYYSDSSASSAAQPASQSMPLSLRGLFAWVQEPLDRLRTIGLMTTVTIGTPIWSHTHCQCRHIVHTFFTPPFPPLPSLRLQASKGASC